VFSPRTCIPVASFLLDATSLTDINIGRSSIIELEAHQQRIDQPSIISEATISERSIRQITICEASLGKGSTCRSATMRTRSQRVDSAQSEQQHADGAVTRARKRASQDHDAPLQDVPLQDELSQDDEADAAPIDDARFLSDSEEVNNGRLRGTLTIIFEDIKDNADTPWRQILRPDIVFQAESAAEKENIGYLNLTLVHTTTFGRGKPWIRGLLRTELEKGDRLRTVSDALRLLWDTNGRLRENAQEYSGALTSNTIAYVCTVFLEEAWRKSDEHAWVNEVPDC